MISFVDIEKGTGNVFCGDAPYVFWFDNEQSTNIIYSKPICFISDKKEVTVKLPSNAVFSLMDMSVIGKDNEVDVYDVKYQDYSKLIVSSGELVVPGKLWHNYYIYIIYFSGSSSVAGEYRQTFTITDDEEHTYTLGADFYAENEPLYINLSNNGIDIPEAIQKALYPSNIREDHRDNILLNRKWKELLSNLWDVTANKGSYKSLYNSLKWFEYGDLLNLYEYWKHGDMYEARDMSSILHNKYKDTLTGFSKTTYIGIYLALEDIVPGSYDDEKNPELKSIVSEWSVQDLSLKLSLLGNFYKTYFMPIHLDLIHSTIEDIVYSNTFKHISAPVFSRNDYIYHTNDFKCNVKDDSIFRLDVVRCYVGPDTIFGVQYRDGMDSISPIGVQHEVPTGKFADNDIKTYLTQLYHDVGCVIDFHLDVPVEEGDYIKRMVLGFKDVEGKDKVIEDYTVIRDGKVDFSLLFREEQAVTITLEIHTASGYIYAKRVSFNIIDTHHTGITIYKVVPNDDNNNNKALNEYVFSRTHGKIDNNIYKQYISNSSTSMKLNHLIVIYGTTNNTYITNNYDTIIRETDARDYTICISKEFNFKPIYEKLNGIEIYREDYIFLPERHSLIEFAKDNIYDIDSYTISDEDVLCVIPDISFGKLIDEYEWEFVNVSRITEEPIKLTRSIKEPFILPNQQKLLSTGYYNIIFRYRLTDGTTNEIILDSAFRKL